MDKTGFEKYRQLPGFRAYKLSTVVGAICPYRVEFFVDSESVGFCQYLTSDMAENAGIDFMFSGELDVQKPC